jgi:hypothetical protein
MSAPRLTLRLALSPVRVRTFDGFTGAALCLLLGIERRDQSPGPRSGLATGFRDRNITSQLDLA